MPNCPKCRTPTLNVVQSAANAPALVRAPLRCARCRGFWLHLNELSSLRESGAIEEMDQDTPPDEASDKRAGLCPDGHGILSRAKASWRRPFYIERCRHCDGIWLDAGEWRRLGAEHLLEHVDELWGPAWRLKLEAEQRDNALHELLESRLGKPLAERIEALADELAKHPHGDLAMAHMREIFRTERPRTKAK